MPNVAGILGGIALLIVSLSFAVANGTQRVRVDLGFWTFYRVPLAWIVFASLLFGMVIMLLVGVHTDLKVRRILRDRLREENLEEQARIDRAQRDLFVEEEDGEA